MKRFEVSPEVPPAIVIEPSLGGNVARTVVVLGAPLGGTSAIAALTDGLGIPFVRATDDVPLRNFENGELLEPSYREFKAAVGRINEKFAVWGFKNPHLRWYDPEYVNRIVRNPHYILVTKDVASMAMRDHFTGKERNLRESLLYQAMQCSHLFFWVASLPRSPLLLVSYMRMIQEPRRTAEIAAEFCGVEVDEAILQRAVARISPVGGYLMSEDE